MPSRQRNPLVRQPRSRNDQEEDGAFQNEAYDEGPHEMAVRETPGTPTGRDVDTAAEEAHVYDVIDDDFELELEEEEEESSPPTYDDVISSGNFPHLPARARRSSPWRRISRPRRLPDVASLVDRESDRPLRRRSASSRRPWKLDYVDFVKPAVTGTSNVPKFESLLEHANAWLLANSDVRVVRCETITWFSADKNHQRTNAVYYKRILGSHKATHYKRGIRLWYAPLQQGVQFSLGIYDYAPPFNKKTKYMTSLVDGLNEQLLTKPIPGTVLTVETVFSPVKLREPTYNTRTKWVELMTSYSKRRYVYFIRIYYMAGTTISNKEEIGFQDIVPHLGGTTEMFSSLAERACQWVATQADLSVINLQSIYVKVKSGRYSEVEVQKSLSLRYQDEPSLRATGTIVHYIQVCRIAYTRSKNEVQLALGDPVLLQHKVFTPEIVPRSSRLEAFRRTVARTSTFLCQLPAGSTAFCVETLMVRPTIKSETFPGRETDQVYLKYVQRPGEETWSVHARLYYRTVENEWPARSSWGSISAMQLKQASRRFTCLFRSFVACILILGISLVLMLTYLLLHVLDEDLLDSVWEKIRNATTSAI